MAALEAENKKFLDALVRHSKGERNLGYAVGGRKDGGSSPRRAAVGSGQGDSKGVVVAAKTKEFVVAPGGKTVTLKQLKDTIE